MKLGFQGGSMPATVRWHPVGRFWFALEEEENRFWNAFGLTDPRSSGNPGAIVVEINPPYSGIDRRMGGAIATDDSGHLYLLHRGKVGGGRKGIGKEAFMTAYRSYGAIVSVEDGGRESEVIVVAALDDPRAVHSIAAFVEQVRRFKAGEAGETDPPVEGGATEIGFRPEFEGKKPQSPRDEVIANCLHGTVVNTLERTLRAQGWVTDNDLRDLLIRGRDREEVAVFEVKSRADRGSIYQAVGQLVLLCTPGTRATRVAVLPMELSAEMMQSLEARDIRVIRFEWDGDELLFHGLSQLLEELERDRPSARGNTGSS